jgi:hypothetical protein
MRLCAFLVLVSASIGLDAAENDWKLFAPVDGLVVVEASKETVSIVPTSVMLVDAADAPIDEVSVRSIGGVQFASAGLRLQAPVKARNQLDSKLKEHFERLPTVRVVPRITWGASLEVDEKEVWSSGLAERGDEPLLVQAILPADTAAEKGTLILEIEYTRNLPPLNAAFTIDWDALHESISKECALKGSISDTSLARKVDQQIAAGKIRIVSDQDAKELLSRYRPFILSRITDTLLRTKTQSAVSEIEDEPRDRKPAVSVEVQYVVRTDLTAAGLCETLRIDRATKLEARVRKAFSVRLKPRKK